MSTFQNKPANNNESYERSRTHKQHGTGKENTGGNKRFSPSRKAKRSKAGTGGKV